MNKLHRQVFLAAVATAALVAFATAPVAQEAKKDASAKKDVSDKHAHQIAQSDLAEVQAGKLGVSKASSPKLVQDTAKNAKDAELKADAEKTAPVIQKHLDEAKRIAASLK